MKSMKNKTISLVIDSLREKYGDMAGEYYVGFSGGIDSTALLLMLVAAGIPVTAVHFEHGLRGDESKADCAWCEEFCRARSIRFLSRSLEVLGNRREGEGIEEAARRLRLEAWQSLVANGTVVFLGHHADDVLEDLFLRLARGSNSSGLTGLREYRELNGLMIHRPLLDLRKDDLEKWLLEQGVADWRIDRTNEESEYRRNAVRNDLLPLARRIFEGDGGFRRSLEVLRADADYLERLSLSSYVDSSCHDLGYWRTLAVDSPCLLPRVFRHWWNDVRGEDVQPSHGTLHRLGIELSRYSGGVVEFPIEGGFVLRLCPDGLELAEGIADEELESLTWRWREQKTIRWGEWELRAGDVENGFSERFLLASLPDELVIRSWLPGDRMIPFGRKGSKKVQDLFVDGKIPRHERKRIPLVCAGDELIWIPGVKRGEFGRVADKVSFVTLICKRVKKESMCNEDDSCDFDGGDSR